MTSTSQRVGATESLWRDTLKRFSASGLSVRAFCKREQLSLSTPSLVH